MNTELKPGAAAPIIPKKPRNRRTLRSRIRKTIYSASMINILIYSILTLLFFAIIFRPISVFTSGFIGHNIVESMNSKAFLIEQEIEGLESFNPNSPRGMRWTERMDRAAKLDTYIPANAQEILEDKEHVIGTRHNFEFVAIEVEIMGQPIYSNKERLNDLFGIGSNKLIDYYSVASVYPLLDERGEEIGSVQTMIAPQLTLAILTTFMVLFLIIVGVTMFISRIITQLISLPVMKPLEQLNSRIRAIAQEDYESNMNSQIQLIKPLREIEELADSTNLIMQKMKEFNERLQAQKSTVEEQNEELEAQNEELTVSKKKLQEAQDSLIIRERSIRNLMDNAGQGFLTFGPDLLVDEEYSLECEKIFGRSLGFAHIAELLACGDPEQVRFLDSLLHKIFEEQDPHRRSIYISLLTDEILIGDRFISVEYKMICRNFENETALMAILTDITEKRRMQSQMDAERNILKMVVKVIVGYGDFTDCVRDYKAFVETELAEIISGSEEEKVKLLHLYRDIHTYKGNFAQFGLTYVTEHLHLAENRLAEAIKKGEELTREETRELVYSFRFQAWLDEDLAVLESVLGDSFFKQQDLLLIDKSRIVDIEKKMIALLSPNECKLLLPDLRKLRYKPFKELLKSYPDFVENLSERLEKFVHPFTVEGDEFDTDTEKYYDFSRSLIHVFRNIIDHGIEPAEERTESGKDEFGTVRCKVSLRGGTVFLSISDDGRGINPDDIRMKAAEKGFMTPEQLAVMEDQEVIELIFRDEFSTREQVTDISGRGMGLSSVKAETEKLGGRVEVISNPGEGTEFRFTLPFDCLSGMPDTDFPAMLAPSIQVAKGYFKDYISVVLDGEGNYEPHPADKLPLKEITSFVTMKGAVEGMFVLSMDQLLSQVLVRNMVLEQLEPDEEERLLEDSLAEASNIILGNSFTMFGTFADYILMEPPITIRTEGASIKFADADIWTCMLHSSHGSLRLSFVLNK